MPDGSTPATPVTIHVDGDLEAVPLIQDLTRAGLRLVEENGQTWLRRAAADEAEETGPSSIDRYHAETVRAFLASVRPLEGCCFCDSAALYAGQAAIGRLARSLDGRGAPPDIAQCVDILTFLSSIQPIDSERCYGHAGQEEAAGFNIILDHIRDTVAAYHEKHEKND